MTPTDKARVILVTGSGPDGDLLEEMLARASTLAAEVTRASGTADAVTRLREESFDACVIDLRSEAARALDRALEPDDEVPALVLVAPEGGMEDGAEPFWPPVSDVLAVEDLSAALLQRSVRLAIALRRCELDAEALRFHEEVVESVGQAVIATDIRGRVMLWNAEAARIYGWMREEVEGRDILEFIPTPQSSAEAMRILEDHGKGKSYSGDFEVRRKDGHAFLAHVTSRPIRDRDGTVIGVVGASRDVTEQRRTEHALQKRVKELRALNRAGSAMNQRDLSVEERLQRVVDALPGGWLHPEVTEARLTLEHRTFSTSGFRETPWMLSTPVASSEEQGMLEIALTEETPEVDGGPFQPEERELLDNVARIVGEGVERERLTQLLYQTLTGIDEAVVILDGLDRERRVRYINPAAERMFGFSWDEWVGETPEKAHPDRASYERFGAAAKEVLAGGQTHRATFPLRRKDGSLFQAEQTVSLLDPKRGLDSGIVTVVRDVSRREAAEAALRESEERFRQIAEHIQDVFWIGSPDGGGIEYVSPAYEKIWGRPRSELYRAAESWERSIVPDDRDRVLRATRQAGEGGFELEYRIIRPEGEVRWIHDRAFPVVEADGRVRRLVGVAEDITERHVAEERFRVLSEEITDAIFVIDVDGRVSFSSGSLETLTGRPLDEILERDALELVHPHDRAAVDTVRDRILAHPDETVRAEYRLLHRHEGPVLVEAVERNLLEHPAIRGIVVTARDVSERYLLERRLRQSQKMEAIGRLAGGIAHDFNNILTVVRSQTELLLLDSTDPALSDDLEVIRGAADRAATLTSQLLAFSREQVLRPRAVDLSEVTRGLATMIDRIVGEDLVIRYELQDGIDAVLVDPGQLEQVVLNLVVNARDAMPEGGRLTISTGVEELDEGSLDDLPGLVSGRYVLLQVSDTGSGIPPEIMSRIFDPFFTTKAQGKGTGLGLAMAYGFLKQSGGGIHAESTEGQGSTFSLRFPASSVEASPVDTPVGPPTEPTSAGGRRVLLLEDDDAVREVTTRILERSGFTVVAFSDLEPALAWIETGHPVELALTDLVLPSGSGQSLIDRLSTKRPGVPVIVMSGYSEASKPVQGDVPGPLCLRKPFTRQALLDAVRASLDG